MSLEPAKESTPDRPGRRPRRRWRHLLLAAAVIILTLVVVVWLALPTIVERRLVEEFAAAGFPDAQLRVSHIGFRQATIADLRLGAAGEITAREVVAEYEPLGLLDGRVARIIIRDPHVIANFSGTDVAIGSLRLPSGTGGSPSLSLALPPVVIENGRIDLTTPVGSVAIPVSGEIGSTDDRTEAHLGFRAEHASAAFAGRLDLALAGAGTVEGEVEITEGTLQLSDDLAAAARGNIRFSTAAAQPLALSAALDLSGIALGPARFPAGRLTATADAAASTANLTLTAKDASSDLKVDASLTGIADAPRLNAAIDLTAAAGAWLWPTLPLPPPSAGSATLALRLEGPLPPASTLGTQPTDAVPLLALLSSSGLNGNGTLDLQDMTWPDLASAVTAKSTATLRPSESGVLNTEFHVEGNATPAATFIESLALPDTARPQLTGPLTFKLAAPLNIRAQSDDKTLIVSGNPTLDLATATDVTANAALTGRLQLSEQLAPLSYYLESGELAARGVATPYGRLETLTATGSIDGRAGSGAGRFSTTARLADASAAGFTAGTADFNLDTSYALADDTLTVKLGDGGGLTLGQLAGASIAGRLKTLQLPLVAGDAPLLQARFAEGGLANLATDLRLGKVEVRPPLLLGGPKPLVTSLTLPGARIAGSWDAAAGTQGTVEFADANLSLPGLAIVANGIGGKVALGAGDPPLTADLRIARVVHGGKSPTAVPVNVTATGDLAGTQLGFRAQVTDARKRLSVAIDGSHALDTGKGRARLRMKPLTFAPGGLQPATLFPQLGRDAEEVAGKVGLDGTISWTGSRVASDLKLLLEDLSMTLPQVQIVKLNTVLAVNSLLPFTTRAKQQVAIGLLEVGIPLTDALMTFDVGVGPTLRIADAHLSLAGGQVTTAPVTLDPAAGHNEVQLKVTDVDLGQLLALAAIDGLSATGTLAGEIPVAIEGSAVIIRNGVLQATGPGTLSYASGQAPGALQGGGASVQLALAALSNFHYTDLRITLDRGADGETVALMQVKGSNPDFYGGYPVDFNLNVSGKLDQILDRSLAGYRVPDMIQHRLREFNK
jgi:hypothetical protein